LDDKTKSIVSEEVSNTKWSIQYYKLNNKNTLDIFTELNYEEHGVLASYMPTLNTENFLVPAPMYLAE
jgi:hypothetical protein